MAATLKLQDVYALPFTKCDLREWCFRGDWLPEIDAFRIESSSTLTGLEQAGRIDVRELVNDYIDGDRVREMHTVWLDGKPVFIVQSGGRGGRDHRKRWVTDVDLYGDLVSHVMTVAMRSEADDVDVHDPNKVVSTDELFCFYGSDVSERFGYEVAHKTPGYLCLFDVRHIVRNAASGLAIVILDHDTLKNPALLIRRDDHFMAYLRPLSDDEFEANPNLLAGGHDKACYAWYESTDRPADLSLAIRV